jgi:hypothetical protein
MEISNSLYYTFSTIAQVLSGFIALSGVFVIFKTQELKKMQFLQVQYFYNYLNGVSGLFIGSFHDCPTIAVKLKTLHKSECIGGMKKEMEIILIDPNVQKSTEYKSLLQMKMVFTAIDSVRLNILFWTKISVISGLMTIIFSLSVLPFVPWVCDFISIILYCTAFFGLIISISFMTKVIFTCLDEKNYLKNEKQSI